MPVSSPRRHRLAPLSWLWRRPYAALFLAMMVIFACYFSLWRENFFGDEGFHIEQIRTFLRGELRMTGAITMIPGYHAVMTAASLVMNRDSLQFYRFVNLWISMLSVPLFYWASRVVDPKASLAKTLQYAFLPILFPFFFLLYTDVLSLVLTFTAVAAVIGRRYGIGGLLGIGAILVRQNNIIWFGFLILLFLFQEERESVRLLWEAAKRRSHTMIGAALRTVRWRRDIRWGWAFILGLILFALFIVINGGMAIGDETAHPFPAVHLGNVYFLFLLSFFLFLPLHLSHLKKIGRSIVQNYFTIPFLVGFFILFMLTFINDHPYNQDINSVFLRNRMLVYTTMAIGHLAIAFLPIAFAALSTGVTELHKRWYVLLYPLTVLYLIPSWLIEQRYFLIPFVLLLLLRRERHPAVEWIHVLYTMLFNAVLFYTVAMRWWFL